ncbi:MAG: hypothetical protein JW767_03255 [Thermoleophilia bacterium]|nr:hypothetical protein [Thermoleophilia bacterium]
MITLVATDGGAVLGTIGEDDLRLLTGQLEEEDSEDTDYFVSSDTIEMLKDAGAGAELIRILTEAVADSEGIEVAWRRD